MRSLGHFSDMSWWHWRVQDWAVNVWMRWESIWIDDVWMHECIWIEYVWMHECVWRNSGMWTFECKWNRMHRKCLWIQRTWNGVSRKPQNFSAKVAFCELYFLWETFIESFRTMVNRFELWTLDWTEFRVAVFLVAECVTVNSRHVVVFCWLTG